VAELQKMERAPAEVLPLHDPQKCPPVERLLRAAKVEPGW
jgi:hypothetical protein